MLTTEVNTYHICHYKLMLVWTPNAQNQHPISRERKLRENEVQ